METHVIPRTVAEKPNSGSFALAYPLSRQTSVPSFISVNQQSANGLEIG